MQIGSGRVKGGVLQSRLEFVREKKGDAGVEGVLKRLSDEDRRKCGQILTGMWYPFELNARLDEAIATEMGQGDSVFAELGEKSATHNLAQAHRAMIAERDPHGLLRRAAQIYKMYYDTGHRTYEEAGPSLAILRTFDSETFSRHDCQTVIGWHRKAIEMCGGRNAVVRETRCRTNGADACEYLCQWE